MADPDQGLTALISPSIPSYDPIVRHIVHLPRSLPGNSCRVASVRTCRAVMHFSAAGRGDAAYPRPGAAFPPVFGRSASASLCPYMMRQVVARRLR